MTSLKIKYFLQNIVINLLKIVNLQYQLNFKTEDQQYFHKTNRVKLNKTFLFQFDNEYIITSLRM